MCVDKLQTEADRCSVSSSTITRSSSKASSRKSVATSQTSWSSDSQRSRSERIGAKAFNALYPEAKTKTSISHLEPLELVWFVECMRNRTVNYYNEHEVHQRTKEVIEGLPKHLRNPLERTGFSQAYLTQFCAKIGASRDTLPQASHLCGKHKGLSAQLTSSARNCIEYVAEDLSDDIMTPTAKAGVMQRASTETLALIQYAENVMALSVGPLEFMTTYRRAPPKRFSLVDCDACFLSMVLKDPDVVCGLRGLALRAQTAGITDDCGNDRTRVCKLLLEACVATHPKRDALLMIEISDTMAEELTRLAVGSGIEPQDDTFNRSRFHLKSWSDDPVTGEFEPQFVPPPLSVRRQTREQAQSDIRSRTQPPSINRAFVPAPLNITKDTSNRRRPIDRPPPNVPVLDMYATNSPNGTDRTATGKRQFNVLKSFWSNIRRQPGLPSKSLKHCSPSAEGSKSGRSGTRPVSRAPRHIQHDGCHTISSPIAAERTSLGFENWCSNTLEPSNATISDMPARPRRPPPPIPPKMAPLKHTITKPVPPQRSHSTRIKRKPVPLSPAPPIATTRLPSASHRIPRKPTPIALADIAAQPRDTANTTENDPTPQPLTPRQLGLIEGSDTPPRHESNVAGQGTASQDESDEVGCWQQMYKEGRLPFSLSHTSSLNIVYTSRSRDAKEKGEDQDGQIADQSEDAALGEVTGGWM